ncbi:RNA polymerase Rpc34 [Immersiella caudata]|uniref:RNA polymerase Rpc34 n=1 Tax=Immersiella caudata TaxID=314043 RepID=A0AA39XFY6_9PEZI|nr:RNA polymerase Rpc34 [Immersiella caudata]
MADVGDHNKIQLLKDLLYSEAQEHGSESRMFSQKDLTDLGVVPPGDPALLLKIIQGLCDDKLFVGVNSPTGIAWRWRNKEDAKKYTSLPNDETMMVYAIIDEAGADGIWNRTIKHKLNMHESVVKNCIKYLETKGYIASMKNVEHPNKKMYIKANLRPSDRATGGPWFTDGELDTAFIEMLEGIVFEYIKTRSAYLGSQPAPRGDASRLKAPKKGVIKGSVPDGETAPRGVKRAATDISNDDVAVPVNGDPIHPAAASSRSKGKIYYPLPAGYRQYPTVSEIAQLIHQTGITNNTTLSEADIQQLVDGLYYDGLIEPVKVNNRRGYRVTRPKKQDTVPFDKRQKDREAGVIDRMGVETTGNGLTETPCGRCPVFDLCEEGGPVSPSNCVYFVQWLDVEDAAPAVKPTGSIAV